MTVKVKKLLPPFPPMVVGEFANMNFAIRYTSRYPHANFLYNDRPLSEAAPDTLPYKLSGGGSGGRGSGPQGEGRGGEVA